MKRILIYSLLFIFHLGFSQEVPKVLKTKFSKEALAQKVQDENGKETSIKDILNRHKGKVVVLDFWAGWCRDCLKAFPKAKELEAQNPNIDFVFLSLERSKANSFTSTSSQTWSSYAKPPRSTSTTTITSASRPN